MGVVYFGVWCSEMWCGSVVWCDIVLCSVEEGYSVGWGRGCSVGVVLLFHWSGIVSWDCCSVVLYSILDYAVFFSVTLFWVFVKFLKKVL